MTTVRNAALAATALATLAACAGPQVDVRRIASPIAQEDLPIADRLAEAGAQMRLGNVGLAIESYRKALRTSPRSALAHAGIAGAYDRMGRYDLSLDHYQVALSLRPDDPRLYAALAGSLRAQGRPVDAARVMAEAQARATLTDGAAIASNEARPPAAFLGPPSAPELVAGSINVLPKPLSADAIVGSITVRLPVPHRSAAPDAPQLAAGRIVSPTGQLPVIELAAVAGDEVPRSGLRPDRPGLADPGLRLAATTLPSVAVATLSAEPAITDLPRSLTPSRPQLATTPIAMTRMVLASPDVATIRPPVPEIPVAPAPSIAQVEAAPPAVDPGPAPLVRDVPLAPRMAASTTPPGPEIMLEAPVAVRPRGPSQAAIKPDRARLERLTSGEVALVTTARPAWETRPAAPRQAYASRVVDRSATSTTVQFTRARVEAAPVMLIAAGAPVQLAEAAKSRLVPQGVAVVDTGRSPTARARSVLLFPKGREEDAKALVASLGFRVAAQVGPVEVMTLHLGRDAQAALLGG